MQISQFLLGVCALWLTSCTGTTPAGKDPEPDTDTDLPENPDFPDTDLTSIEQIGQTTGTVTATGLGASPNYRARVVVGGAVTEPAGRSASYTTHIGIGTIQPVEEAP
jgi:hypothetical protein